MSVSGLCGVCENATAEYSCTHCGQLVCQRHYDEGSHLCAECDSQLRGSGRSDPEDLPDGVDTYQF